MNPSQSLWLTYLHPVTGGVVVLWLVWVGTLGLRARSQPRRARALLRQHERWALWVYAAVLTSWVGGVATTWWLRPELELAESTHFQLGLAMVVLLTGSTVTSRWPQHAWARDSHPWLGATALLVATAQVFFGLQMTP